MKAVRKFPELFELVGYAEENERWIEKRGELKGYHHSLHQTKGGTQKRAADY